MDPSLLFEIPLGIRIETKPVRMKEGKHVFETITTGDDLEGKKRRLHRLFPSKPGRIARISKEQSALLERALQTPSYDRQVGKKHPVLGKPSGFRFFEKRIPHPIAAVVEGVPPLPGET